jgi:hypothetical protein
MSDEEVAHCLECQGPIDADGAPLGRMGEDGRSVLQVVRVQLPSRTGDEPDSPLGSSTAAPIG